MCATEQQPAAFCCCVDVYVARYNFLNATNDCIQELNCCRSEEVCLWVETSLNWNICIFPSILNSNISHALCLDFKFVTSFYFFLYFSDHDYEPIEAPPGLASLIGPPVLEITEPDHITTATAATATATDLNNLGVAQKSVMRSMEFDANDELCIEKMQQEIEDGLRSSTPLPDHLRENIENEDPQGEDDVEAEPKKSFFSEVSTRTKNVQHKLSTQASHLRMKFKRTKKPKAESPKTSPRNSLMGSPTEQKKFSQKLKNIHMPKIGKPEFKRPEFTKFKRPDFKLNMPDFPKVPAKLRLKRSSSLKEPTTVVTEVVEETVAGERPIAPVESASETTTTITTVTTTHKKLFEYPKFLERFRRHSRDESTADSRGSRPDADDEGSPPVEVTTIPRTSKTTKARNFIAARWGRKPSEASYTDNESGKYQRYNSEGGSLERETSTERRMRVALKNSLEDEEEPLGILQTDEQKQLAEYDEENRAIHVISEARKGEFDRRKPLVHQESDIVSDEQDFDWAECERMRESLVAQRVNDFSAGCSEHTDPPTEHFASNESNVETQSSGSSSRRRRTGTIEELDDDEFYLRSKGISEDDIQMGEYISSVIRDGLQDPSPNALERMGSYDRYYDDNFNISSSSNRRNEELGYDVPPSKPKRFTKNSFNKSLESDDFSQGLDSRQSLDDPPEYYRSDPDRPPRRTVKRYESDMSDELPVSVEYYPRYDDDAGSYYENEQMDGIEQPDIRVTNVEKDNLYYDENLNDDDALLARQATPPTPPKAPKRKKKSRSSVGRESMEGRFKGRSNSLDPNGNKEEVSNEQ